MSQEPERAATSTTTAPETETMPPSAKATMEDDSSKVHFARRTSTGSATGGSAAGLRSSTHSNQTSTTRGNKLFGVRLETITRDDSLSKTDLMEGIMGVLRAMKKIDHTMVLYNHSKKTDSRIDSLKDLKYIKGNDESCAELKEYFDMQILPWTGRAGTQKKFFSSFAIEGSRQLISWCQTRGNASFPFPGKTNIERIFLIAPHTFTRSQILAVGYILFQDPRSAVQWNNHRERLQSYLKFQLQHHPVGGIKTVPKFFTRGGVKVPFQDTSVDLFCIETIGGEPFDNLQTLLEKFCTFEATETRACPFTVILQTQRKKNPAEFEQKIQQHNQRIADMARIPIGGMDPEINNRYRHADDDDKTTVTSFAHALCNFSPNSNNSDNDHPIYDLEGPMYFDTQKGGKFYVVVKRSAEVVVTQWLNENLANLYAKYNVNGKVFPACPDGPIFLADTSRRSSIHNDIPRSRSEPTDDQPSEHVMNGGGDLTVEQLKAENAQLRRRNRQLEDRNAELNRKKAQLRREIAALVQQVNKLDNILH